MMRAAMISSEKTTVEKLLINTLPSRRNGTGRRIASESVSKRARNAASVA